MIPYLTAGDPSPELTVPLVHALVEAGADLVEIGIPFSDPMADGPVIQRSGERALRLGVSLPDVLDMAARFRERDQRTPVVLMGYANPIEAIGRARFIERARQAGIDGVIVVDYPPEESGEFARALAAANIDLIFLLAPTSSETRMAQVSALAGGYLYYVSLAGVTGASHLDLEDVRARLSVIRRHTRLPIAVGFGIRDAGSARAVASVADGIIVGSRLIEEIEAAPAAARTRAASLIRELRAAIDAGSA